MCTILKKILSALKYPKNINIVFFYKIGKFIKSLLFLKAPIGLKRHSFSLKKLLRETLKGDHVKVTRKISLFYLTHCIQEFKMGS